MLATLVIGLREGLEAALIVGIIAAFLKQNGRADALKKMWAGVVVAVLLCLTVGLLLQSVNSSLPQRQQEMLECVVAAIAVVMVSYMVLWMRAHSRSLKADLQKAAGGALASGSATALIVMAFLAVLREGFETAVFLLAAFQSAVSPVQAASGAITGIVVAVALGYLIYRGGVKLNLAKFFRITGVVLVLVAAGLVISTLRAAYEAGWLTIGQQHAVSLSLVARPGTVQESLLTGVLGIRSTMPTIEVLAYVLYVVPMLAVVLWPAKWAMNGRSLGRVRAGVAAAALVVAAGFLVLAPPAPSSSTAALSVTSTGAGGGSTAAGAPSALTATLAGGANSVVFAGAVAGTSQLQISGHASAGGIAAAQYTGSAITSPVTPTAALPTTLTLAQVAAMGDGRLPIGLSVSGRTGAAVTAAYTDTATPVLSIDPATGRVLDIKVTVVRTLAVTNPAGATFPVGAVSTTVVAATPVSVSSQVAASSDFTDRQADHQVLGHVIPGLLVVFALVLLAFAAPHLLRRKPNDAHQPPPGTFGHESSTPVAAGSRTN